MERIIREDPWPMRRLIALPVSLGPLIFIGFLIYDRGIQHHHRIVPWPNIVGSALLAFGFLYLTIVFRFRPKGRWTETENGLSYTSYSGNTHDLIPWNAIEKMDATPVSLVIVWTDPEPESPPNKTVLWMQRADAAELIAAWRRHPADLGE
jgi:hypothetical protein